MNAETSLPRRAWLTVALLWLVGGFNYLDRTMVATMHESLTAAIPMTEAQFGLLTSAFLWVYGGLSPLAGFLADRFSRSRLIVVSMLLWSAVTWLTAHATTYGELLTTRVLMGVTEATYLPAALALITDYHRGATRASATAVHITGISAGTSLAGVAGWLAERHTWNYPFQLFGALGIGYCGVLWFALRDAPREPPAAADPAEAPQVRLGEAARSLFGTGSYLLLLAFWGIVGISGWAVNTWMPTYLGEHFRIGQGEAGLTATGYVQAAGLVGVLVGGVWSDRWSRTNARARVFVTAIGLAAATVALLVIAQTVVLAVAIGGLIVFGFGRSFIDSNTMPVLCLVADPRYRATGFGIMNFFGNAVGGLTTFGAGALRDGSVSLGQVFQFGAISLLLCAGLLLCVRTRPEPGARRDREPVRS